MECLISPHSTMRMRTEKGELPWSELRFEYPNGPTVWCLVLEGDGALEGDQEDIQSRCKYALACSGLLSLMRHHQELELLMSNSFSSPVCLTPSSTPFFVQFVSKKSVTPLALMANPFSQLTSNNHPFYLGLLPISPNLSHSCDQVLIMRHFFEVYHFVVSVQTFFVEALHYTATWLERKTLLTITKETIFPGGWGNV